MVINKSLLAGLVGASLCTANISGIVTDTGTTPIKGAVVQLEKGGQTATTGEDGRFTLLKTAVLSRNVNPLPNGLSARISGNLITISLSHRSVVEVATFDLGGKALSTVRRPMDAGSCSIELPYCGAGVYLYRVKSGNSELVLIGNTVGRVSLGSAISSTGLSPNYLAKQVQVSAKMDDVIVVTKEGYLNYRCVQYNDDTSGVTVKMIVCADTVRDIDGNVYQAVRIGNQVWMAENLRVTKYSNGTGITLDTSAVTWENATTPKYCYYHNTANPDSIKKYGALYNWYVVNPANLKKIAPTGWHVPTDAEWDILRNYLVSKGYNWDRATTGNKVAKSLAAQTDWQTFTTAGTIGRDMVKNNRSGFSAFGGGCRSPEGAFNSVSSNGFWWCATDDGLSGAWCRNLYNSGEDLVRYSDSRSYGFSVRLLKNVN